MVKWLGRYIQSQLTLLTSTPVLGLPENTKKTRRNITKGIVFLIQKEKKNHMLKLKSLFEYN